MPQGPESGEQGQQQKGPQQAPSSPAPPSNQELLAQIARLYRTMGVLQQEMAAAASFAPAGAEGNEDGLQQQPFPPLPLAEQPRITKQQRGRHELAQYMDGRNAAHDALRERAVLSGRAGQDGTAAVAVAGKQRQQLSLSAAGPVPQSPHEEERAGPASNNLWQPAAAVKIISAGAPARFPEGLFDVYPMGVALEDAAGNSGRPQDDFAAVAERAQSGRRVRDAAGAVAGLERKKKRGAGSSSDHRFAVAVGGSDDGDDGAWRLDSYNKKDFGVQV